MDKNHGLKALILSIFSTLMFSNVSAASPWNTDIAVNALVGVARALTWYEIQTWFDALFFFVTWLSLYFISVKFVQTVWKLISKRISRGSGGRFSPGLGGGDSPDFYEKGLAVTVSLLGTQYIGPALAPILGVTWGIFGLILALAVWAMFQQFLGGKMSSSDDSGGGGDPATDGGTGAKSNPGVIQKQLDTLNSRLDSLADEINESEQEGNADEAEDAAEKMQTVLKQIKEVEMELEDLLEADEGDLSRAIEEAQEIIQAENQEEKDITDIQNRLQRAGKALEVLNVAVKMGAQNGASRTGDGDMRASALGGGAQALVNQMSDQLRNNGLNPEIYGNTYWGLKQVWEEDIQGIERDINDIIGIEKRESSEVSDEVQRIEREAKKFVQAYQLIQEVKQLVQEAESEDKALEQIAKQARDKKLAQEVSVEENEEGQLESVLKDLMSKEEMIEKELEKAAQLLEKELEADNQEEQQIKTEIQESTSILKELEALKRQFGEHYDHENAGRTTERISQIEGELSSIEDQMEKIAGLKENEIQKIQEAESAISEALNR